jgi:hypothetical protein
VLELAERPGHAKLPADDEPELGVWFDRKDSGSFEQCLRRISPPTASGPTSILLARSIVLTST